MVIARDALFKSKPRRAGGALAILFAGATLAVAQPGRDTLVVTSANGSPNQVLVFKLNTSGTPSLTLVNTLSTGGNGGAAGGSAGALQFSGPLGAVANFGSNTVSQLARFGDSVAVTGTVKLAEGCTHPVSVALGQNHLFVAGANCAEAHDWPSGSLDTPAVALPDKTAAQIALGQTWAAVTLTSGSLLELPLSHEGSLTGASTSVSLPADADNTPLGEAFWQDLLGFTPAHSPDSFALVNAERDVFPVVGPAPPYPSNAPCWVAKGAGNIWYTGNSPGHAVSIFFSDDQGGVFYKSVPLPGAPTDITVSPDGNWLAVIYTDNAGGHIAVFSIDAHGGLTAAATTAAVGVAAFDGVAFSQ